MTEDPIKSLWSLYELLELLRVVPLDSYMSIDKGITTVDQDKDFVMRMITNRLLRSAADTL